ncbi:putative succinate dehydrogenase cytochrome b subunit [Trichoderma citrinoviride]|uniref:Putative succinate dehydrogenase cytochrome b subunit n=1 Tax=Trichoderma citrinoviride TaxID=58853 RepID=A0A2T4BJC6_9HYPO|nr:putative succinate dehydrogenase cytochrome b subunit [Trichoderma citrinoviride]PTB69422.1 putative succinate dehydrogenase cytochrome b subunit [Trichoderma citrinoviride]
MNAHRFGLAAVRSAKAPTTPFFTHALPRSLLAATLSTTSKRPITTQKLSQEQGQEVLASQRLNRPVSPHLGIYKMEQTWFGASAWTRITGCTLSGAAYVYFTAYLVSPLLGFHVESAALASGFAALPFVVKGAIKFALAFPFTFHFINGIKHLIYDVGVGFAKKHILLGEKLLWISSFLGGGYLAFGV